MVAEHHNIRMMAQLVKGRRVFIASCKPFSSKPSYGHANVYLSVLSTLSRSAHDYDPNEQSIISNISIPLYQTIKPKLIATQSINNTQSSLILSSQYMLRYISNTIRYFNRIVAYLIYGSPLFILTPLTLTLGKYLPWLEDVSWDYCLWSVLKLVPTFIKMAQWVRILIIIILTAYFISMSCE